MLNGALLGIMEESGLAVLTLAENLSEREFFSSRLTRAEVQRHLKTLAETSANLPAAVKSRLPEVDWAALAGLPAFLRADTAESRSRVWSAIHALIPDTLMWLRVYRKNEPELFSFTP